MPEFREWPKIARWERPVVITEKIDGTNACVIVPEDIEEPVWAQSRKRLITPEQDNYGFARWVDTHAEELRQLGPGYHYGEWYGLGIQRGYGLNEKRFALFNADRWTDERPSCCNVVPVLARCTMSYAGGEVARALDSLRRNGSYIAPGFMQPEGIIIYSQAARVSFKMTLDGDAKS